MFIVQRTVGIKLLVKHIVVHPNASPLPILENSRMIDVKTAFPVTEFSCLPEIC